MKIPGSVEDTSPAEGSRRALEGKHEVETLGGLQGQIADSVEWGSIGESTVAAKTSVDLADEVVAETAAAAAAVDFADFADFADSAGSAVEVEIMLVDAAAGFELAAMT